MPIETILGFATLTWYAPRAGVWGGVGAENDGAFHFYQQFAEQGAFEEPGSAEASRSQAQNR